MTRQSVIHAAAWLAQPAVTKATEGVDDMERTALPNTSWHSLFPSFFSFSSLFFFFFFFFCRPFPQAKIAVPVGATELQFCVCYQAGGREYWDNNGGKNYILRV